MPLKISYWASLKKWFCGPNFWRGLALYTSFVLVLAFFLHFREVRMEVLELGRPAPRYVIAQIDFSFSDTEATQILKQEAVRDIGRIDKISAEEIHRFRVELEQRFVSEQQWRRALDRTFQEVYHLLEETEKELIGYRFTDKRTFQKIEELQFEPGEFYPLFVISREPKDTVLPEDFWAHLSDRLKKNPAFHADAVNYVVSFFAREPWILEVDVSTERYVRQLAQDKVPD